MSNQNLVSFPMYQFLETDHYYQSFWEKLQYRFHDYGIQSAKYLTQPAGDLISHWRNPNLLLSQTCGYPLMTQLSNSVKIIGTPIYQTPCSNQHRYCSLFIVNKKNKGKKLLDYAGKRFAYNSLDSQSGFNIVRETLFNAGIKLPFFNSMIKTDSHRNSLLAVANNQADICAIDCISYYLIEKYQPDVLENSEILAPSKATIGLPFITSKDTDDETADELFNAIKSVLSEKSSLQIKEALLLNDIKKSSMSDYQNEISIQHSSIINLA